MPELSEVKIMSDFINHVSSVERFFERIEKSPVTKVKTPIEVFNGGVFTIAEAKSRGKELMIVLEMVGGDIHKSVQQKLFVSLGMSGSWVYMRKDSPHIEKALKHSHLRFITTHGNYLMLHDIRRFAKWRWDDKWHKGRGPCPLTEFEKFCENIKLNWKTHRAFKSPLNELLMNQTFFNGLGNYIRSESLYRTKINPFMIANKLNITELNNLLDIIHKCFRDSYALGGGQLRDWHNPYGTEGKTFKDWIKCYGLNTMNKIKDNTGRTFWYDPIWYDECKKLYN